MIEACYIEYKDNLRYPLNVFGAQLKELGDLCLNDFLHIPKIVLKACNTLRGIQNSQSS